MKKCVSGSIGCGNQLVITRVRSVEPCGYRLRVGSSKINLK